MLMILNTSKHKYSAKSRVRGNIKKTSINIHKKVIYYKINFKTTY